MSQLTMFSNAPVKASAIIGSGVFNPKGESLGEIKEIVIDPRIGKVAYVVVAFGGFLGLGEKLFAIPFSSFAYNVAGGHYVLEISPDRLKEAPGFDADHWPAMSDEKWNLEVHHFYGGSPYWT
jgi:sporulation protein YlmC with PRC-barrel domain